MQVKVLLFVIFLLLLYMLTSVPPSAPAVTERFSSDRLPGVAALGTTCAVRALSASPDVSQPMHSYPRTAQPPCQGLDSRDAFFFITA